MIKIFARRALKLMPRTGSLLTVALLLFAPLAGNQTLLNPFHQIFFGVAYAFTMDPGLALEGKKLGRGINLGDALEAPKEGEWGVVLQPEYFPLIARKGFQTVRLPIRWSSHASNTAPYTIDESFFKRIDWAISQALENQLNVVINLHHYDELFEKPDAHEKRFLALWEQIALRYKDKPAALYFEPLNEPHEQMTPKRWNELLKKTIVLIRRTNPQRYLIIDTAEWAGWRSLASLKLLGNDQRLIVSIHYYEPMYFTHQNADWAGDEFATTGLVWPGPPRKEIKIAPKAAKFSWAKEWFKEYNDKPLHENPCSPDAVENDFDQILKWSQENNRLIWLGEFGTYETAEMDSRVRWTVTVRKAAEKRGIPWAYWEFCSGFGVYEPNKKTWHEKLLKALIEK